ncbi:MAG TPA: hypothetical protein VIK78_16865 [Ruminiclostridium sp.]
MKKYFCKVVAITMSLALILAAGCGIKDEPAATTTPVTSLASEAQPTVTAEKADTYAKMAEMVAFTTGGMLPAEPKYPEGESNENNDILTWVKDNMNIDIKYEWTASDQNNAYDSKLNLLIASNEIPDFLSIGGPNAAQMLKKLIDADMIQDLTKVYEDYASPTFKGMHENSGNVALKSVTFDGKLMAIPSLSDVETAAAVMWYRQDMLDKAGLQAPKNVDDVINIVKVLNEKGITKNAVLPARADMELFSGDTATFDWLFSAYNTYPGMWIEGKDGSVVYGSIQPEVKTALAKAQEIYKAGIIPSDFALWDGNKAVELVSSNKIGIFQGAWWSTAWPIQDSMKNDATANWKATLLQSADGNYYQRGYAASKGFLVIKKGVEHPEAIMKLINVYEDCALKKNEWYNALTTNENAKYKNTGGTLFPALPGAKYLDEISRRYNAIMDVVNGKVKKEDADAETAALAANVLLEKEKPMADIANWATAVSWTEGAAAFAKVKMIQKMPAFDGTTDTLTKSKAILTDLEKQTFLKIIMGKVSIDEFDKFVEQWKKLGGETVTQEINALKKK